MLRTRAFWMLSFTCGIFAMVLHTVALYTLPHLEAENVPSKVAALIVMFIPLASVPGRFFMGLLGDFLDKRIAMIISFISMSLGLFFIYTSDSIWQYFLFLTFFGIGFGGFISLRAATIREYFGRDHFGSVQGMLAPILVLGGLVGPPLAGWIFDQHNGLDMAWLICMIATISAILLILGMGPKYIGHP